MGKLLSIVINNNHIRIAELSLTKKGVSVSRLLTKEIPGQYAGDGTIRKVGEFADFLNATLRNANIKTKRVVFSLPSDKIMTREVILPAFSEEKLKITILANAAEYFPIDLSEYVLSYFTISKIIPDDVEEVDAGGKKKKRRKASSSNKKKKAQLRLMVVAAPNDMIQSYYDAARMAKLKIEAVDYSGNSVFQLTSNQIGEEPCLVIQLDRDSTVLTVYHDNVMVLQRHVDFGSTAVIQAAAEQASGDYEQAEQMLEREPLIHDNFEDEDPVTDSLYYLVSNIKRVIEYYAGRNPDCPLEQVSVIGEGSAMPGLELLLENQLNLPVETITALKQVFVKESTGLSMKEVLKYMDNIGAVIEPVNFLPKKLERDMRRKLERKVYRVMILLALFTSLVIITIPATKFFTTAMETLDLKNRLVAMEDVKPILDRYKQAEQRYADVQTVQAYARTNNRSLRGFIDIFEQLRPSNVSITDFTCVEGEISFNALAGGKRTVAKLIQQLNMVANVSEVKVSNLSSSFEGNVETVSFSVTCRLINEDVVLGEVSEGDSDTGAVREQEAYDYVNDQLSEVLGQTDSVEGAESMGESVGEGESKSEGESEVTVE